MNYTILLSLFILFSFISCTDDSVKDEGVQASLKMQMNGASTDLINNTSIYVFNTQNKFVEKKLNVLRSGGEIRTSMKVGEWNLVLLTNNNVDISKNIILPAYQNAMGDSPMWRTNKTSDGLFLSQTPEELRYASIPNTEIKINETTTRSTILNRNVAKIQVILTNYSGFDAILPGINKLAFVELLDVPTTLSWDGGLYPNKIKPDVSDKPIREYFNFNEKGKADILNFVVPAHRGADAFTSQHKDTTTHKLKLRASMPLNGIEYYGKGTFEIAYTPKINSITQINLILRGEPNATLDIKVSVKDWETIIDQAEEL